MKNKAGTAAGNPRARSDRASPTANGLPNTQVSSVFVYLTTAITISAAFPTPYTTSIVIILLWRAAIELCVCARPDPVGFSGWRQPSFGF